MRIFLFLAEGFEEIEAIAPVDIFPAVPELKLRLYPSQTICW